MVCNVLGELAKGRGVHGALRPVTTVPEGDHPAGTDQPLADWREVMVPNGLMVHKGQDDYKTCDPVCGSTPLKTLHLDEAGIEQITADCEEPGAVLVLDAFLSLIGPLGLDSDSEGAVEPLPEPAGEHCAVQHHYGVAAPQLKKRAHERASNASAGSGFFQSHVVNLHWLNPDAKEDHRVRLTTEGRSSKSVDCVIEQVERAIWTLHGDSSTQSCGF